MSDEQAEADALKLRIEQTRARLQALEARYAQAARKNDTRRKIIAGGLLFDAAEKDPRFAAVLGELLTRIERPNDKKPFAGWAVPGASQAPSQPRSRAALMAQIGQGGGGRE